MKIAVIALLKPSQVKYKITPLLRSDAADAVILFRKNKYQSSDPKLIQYVLPAFMSYKPFYWTLTPFYIAYKLRRHDVDLLLTYRFIPHTYYTWVVSKLLKKPFIYSQIDADVVTLHQNPLGKLFVEYIMSAALQINTPGMRSLNYWRKVFPTKKINVLHSTIDTNVFHPVSCEQRYDLMYVGVLTELKRVGLMIEMFWHLTQKAGRDYKFAIVGYGPLEIDLRELVSKLGLSKNVDFLGKRVVDSNLLCQTRIFSMASTSEGLPCALMEAMACERLCITTNVGNISDAIIDKETGFFYNSVSPKHMAEQVSELLDNYDNLKHIRQSARNHIIQNHSFLSATRKWDRLLNNLELP